MNSSYAEKLRDPRWQKKRLRILERDNWACVVTGRTDETLNVHHQRYYKEPWDTPDEELETVCERIHREITPLAALARTKLSFPVSARRLYAAMLRAVRKLSVEDLCREPIWEGENFLLISLFKIKRSQTHTHTHTQGSLTVTDLSKTA